ncbi:MAG: Arc family DNA-binding protein [Actinophytocola sp.]|nr:Arc family DNA-binding protein [Actinophytocola sp.]
MPAIHVRNVPESTLSALRERAERHGRSMQQEVLEILENAAAEPVPAQAPAPIQLVTTTTSVKATWRREDIYDDEGG